MVEAAAVIRDGERNDAVPAEDPLAALQEADGVRDVLQVVGREHIVAGEAPEPNRAAASSAISCAGPIKSTSSMRATPASSMFGSSTARRRNVSTSSASGGDALVAIPAWGPAARCRGRSRCRPDRRVDEPQQLPRACPSRVPVRLRAPLLPLRALPGGRTSHCIPRRTRDRLEPPPGAPRSRPAAEIRPPAGPRVAPFGRRRSARRDPGRCPSGGRSPAGRPSRSGCLRPRSRSELRLRERTHPGPIRDVVVRPGR